MHYLRVITAGLLAALLAINTQLATAGYESEVETAQSQLNELGYDAGPEDGFMGPLTRKAIRKFQADADLPTTGELDTETRDALSEKVAAAEESTDVPATSSNQQSSGSTSGSFLSESTLAYDWLEFAYGFNSIEDVTGSTFHGRLSMRVDTHMVGKADIQYYTADDGELELSGLRLGAGIGYLGNVLRSHEFNIDAMAGGRVELQLAEISESGFGSSTEASAGLTGFAGLRIQPARILSLESEVRLGVGGPTDWAWINQLTLQVSQGFGIFAGYDRIKSEFENQEFTVYNLNFGARLMLQ